MIHPVLSNTAEGTPPAPKHKATAEIYAELTHSANSFISSMTSPENEEQLEEVEKLHQQSIKDNEHSEEVNAILNGALLGLRRVAAEKGLKMMKLEARTKKARVAKGEGAAVRTGSSQLYGLHT
ncbi:hypothetical protein TrST_g1082 [Triparma strigata]|uniref:Uncharacterized protein n=1 Tax=Triparma strigata TaxID=1606541 RepID=A0A9W7C4M4_9STRA|nr:hypothetical protein TrST_g1082 [Triparma strigata]